MRTAAMFKRQAWGMLPGGVMVCLLWLGCTISHGEPDKTVICVGNSITAGDWLADRTNERYPAVLQRLLGDEWEVKVIAKGGLCVQREAEEPMWDYGPFASYFTAEPDITVLLLGTNDSRTPSWVDRETFARDCNAFLDTLLSVEPTPKLFVGLPPPAFSGNFDIHGSIIEDHILPVVDSLAGKRDLPTIDFFELFSQNPDYLHDGIHPDKDGAAAMAALVHEAITEGTSVALGDRNLSGKPRASRPSAFRRNTYTLSGRFLGRVRELRPGGPFGTSIRVTRTGETWRRAGPASLLSAK